MSSPILPTPAGGASRPLLPPILPVEPDQPLRWLVLGFRDITRNPLLSLAHGLAMAVAGWFFTWLAYDQFWVLVGLVSAFMVTAPVLATSLYAMSRAIERGETVNLALLVNTWTRWNMTLQAQPDSYWALIRFGLLLGLAAVGWVTTSSAFIWMMTPVPIHTPMDFLRHVVASQNHHLFELWLGLGGLMAAPLFASSVVSMPLLLDRPVGLWAAVHTSWRVVAHNPGAMGFWAFLLTLFTLLGMGSALLGLLEGLGGTGISTALLEVLVDRVMSMAVGPKGLDVLDDLRMITSVLVQGEGRLDRLARLVDLAMDNGVGLEHAHLRAAMAGITFGLRDLSSPSSCLDAELHGPMVARLLRSVPGRATVHVERALKALWEHMAEPGAMSPGTRQAVKDQVFACRDAAGPQLMAIARQVLPGFLSLASKPGDGKAQGESKAKASGQ